MPCRQTEGIARGYSKGRVPSIPHYTTISRRINILNINVEDTITLKKKSTKDNYIIIAIGYTGIKITNRDQWIREMEYKKGYMKIHIAINIKSKKITSIMKVSDEHVYDNKILPQLIDDFTNQRRKLQQLIR